MSDVSVSTEISMLVRNNLTASTGCRNDVLLWARVTLVDGDSRWWAWWWARWWAWWWRWWARNCLFNNNIYL